jgi:hypothetical protein
MTAPAGLTFRDPLRRDYRRMLRSRIPHGLQDPRLAESRLPQFVEEGAALPGSGDSGKPIGA